MDLNKVIIVGNLTKDPELKYTPGGTAVCEMRLAANHRYRRGGEGGEMVDETCFVDVASFGRSGENCNQYLRKGSTVLVEGRLKFDQWTSQDGQKRSKHSVVADRVHFFPKSGGGAGSGGGGESQSYGKNFRGDAAPPGGDFDAEPAGEGERRETYDSEVPF
jgi:single-strand DNA-binding protein